MQTGTCAKYTASYNHIIRQKTRVKLYVLYVHRFVTSGKAKKKKRIKNITSCRSDHLKITYLTV